MRREGVLTSVAALALAGCGTFTRIDYTHLFTRAGWQRPDLVIEALALEPGDQVADIGAGEGWFSFYLADAVGPDGRVYAVDVDPAAVRAVEDEARERGYTNVVAVLAKPEDPLLPDRAIDLAFFCNSYHHIENRGPYLERLRGDLAPGARVAVIDVKESGIATLFVPAGHGTPVPVMRTELAAARYPHRESHDFLPVQSFEIFALGDGE
jgi:ubiquinone/menaquinone biosynthesis C-methylase UbiE